MQEISHRFSVIICCYNAAKRLRTTLEYLSKLDITGINCELIIVDNNSSDNTFEVVTNCWKSYGSPFELIYLKEKKPGKTNAWNLGVKNANGNYLLMCDDDNWIPTDYLKKAIPYFELDSKIAMLGGQSIGVFEENPPAWFYERQHIFAVGKQYENDGFISDKKQRLWGAGTFFKKEPLIELLNTNYIQLYSGLKQEGMTEDYELFILLRFLGYEMYYTNELVIKHYMPKGRITWENYLSFFKNFGQNLWKLEVYEKEALQNDSFIKAWLKQSTIFSLYINILSYKKALKSKHFFTKPSEGEKSEIVSIFTIKHKFIGLIKAGSKYRKSLNKFHQSKLYLTK